MLGSGLCTVGITMYHHDHICVEVHYNLQEGGCHEFLGVFSALGDIIIDDYAKNGERGDA